MERQSRCNCFGNIPDKDIEKCTDLDATRDFTIKRGKMSLIKQYLIDYTANSNLHGLKYVGEKERTTVEKAFWLLMFTCSIVFCSSLIHKLWMKWNDSPVIVTFAETSTPVWQIPYPAVTLCAEMKVKQTSFNYTEYYNLKRKPTNVEEAHLFEDLTMICNKIVDPWTHGRNFTLGNETVKNIKKVSPSLKDIFTTITWKDKLCPDLNLFLPILTEEGYCYTFNTISANQLLRIENLNTDYNYLKSSNEKQTWTLENGYPPNTPFETYPHRGTGYGDNAGLSLLLQAKKKDFDYLCSGPIQGFKILLHNPADFPRLSQQYLSISLGRNVIIAVKPKMMTTSEGLKSYNPRRRQCFFSSERYLRFFKVYTQVNCETECLTNFTYVRCGCVHFGMPHGPEMRVCSVGKLDCIIRARMDLVTVEVQSNLEEAANTDDSMGEARRVATNCKCLPACTSIEYEAEISQGDFNAEALYRALNYPLVEDIVSTLHTQTKIFFKEAQFNEVRRSELYGQTDFLANCGGLLGLFLGFSILSIVEIIYFLTLRICCILWRRRQNSKI
ncbi:pickpocket protein 28-like [Melitaea cinxia]|uniref:pickpocket protein 28-like n=1 Tax=Melitaea cinxia TaxID=113334 RepID=UPI001E272389|nr:pickpocket protein 28-like [Melitaea cinxia]